MPAAVARLLLIGSFLPFCWLGMQAVHELGHVIGAYGTGGRVQQVVLHPLTFSRTDVAPNPMPLAVVWAGPLLGILIPCCAAVIAHRCQWPAGFLWRFFAGFCLLANGGYIGLGSFQAIADCGEMLKNGSPMWTLWLFGAATVPAGLWCWHGLGPHFAIGHRQHEIKTSTVWTSIGLLLVMLVLSVAVSAG